MIAWEEATVDDAVKAWDAGESIWSYEMGGLSPGYEQAIQILIVELLRDQRGKPLPESGRADSWGDDTVKRINSDCLGFSGAQVGAAKSVAFAMLRKGYAVALKEMKLNDTERLIQISNRWPCVASPPSPQKMP